MRAGGELTFPTAPSCIRYSREVLPRPKLYFSLNITTPRHASGMRPAVWLEKLPETTKMPAGDVQEPAADPQMLELLKWAGIILYWIVYPIYVALYHILYWLAWTVLVILKLLYKPLEFLLLPVIFLLRFIGICITAPFRFLARFETLYIYLGIGAIVGCVLGLLLSLTYGALQGPLGLDAASKGRTAKQYREEKSKQKVKAEAVSLPNSHGYLSPSQPSMSEESRSSNRRRRIIGSTMPSAMYSD